MTQHDVRVIAMQALYLADQVHEHEDVDAIKKKTMDVLDIKEFPDYAYEILQGVMTVSYTHLTLPTTIVLCRSRWSPYH